MYGLNSFISIFIVAQYIFGDNLLHTNEGIVIL